MNNFIPKPTRACITRETVCLLGSIKYTEQYSRITSTSQNVRRCHLSYRRGQDELNEFLSLGISLFHDISHRRTISLTK